MEDKFEGVIEGQTNIVEGIVRKDKERLKVKENSN